MKDSEVSSMNVKVPTKVKNEAKIKALKLGISLKEFVVLALIEKVSRDKGEQQHG